MTKVSVGVVMLDGIQKVIDISLKGVIATILAVGTYILLRDKSIVDQRKICDDIFVSILGYIERNRLTDNTEKVLNHRLDNYPEVCKPLRDDLIASLKLSWKPPDKVAQSASSPLGQTAWVAVSRKNPEKYSDSNFDRVDNTHGALNEGGALLKARWQVNLREKNTPVSAGDNPVVGVLSPGDCVKVLEGVAGQLNVWAKVSQQACP